MNKKDWCMVTGMLILPVLLDQMLKQLFARLPNGSEMMLGPVGVAINQEQAALSSSFNIAEYITVVSSFSFSIFFLFLFFVLNTALPHKVMGFRLSCAFFTAGLLGDGVDTLFRGGGFNWIKLFGLSMNLTDIYIVVGTVLTVFFCIKNRALLFRKNNVRKKMFIEKDQYRFCFYTLFCWLFLNCALYIFFYSFIKIIFKHFVTVAPVLQSQIMSVFSLLFCILSLCFLLIMSAFSIYLSNKIYGPVYAFKKYIKDIFLNGEADRPFHLREGDHFKDLPDLISKMRAKYLEKGAKKGK